MFPETVLLAVPLSQLSTDWLPVINKLVGGAAAFTNRATAVLTGNAVLHILVFIS